MKTRSKTELYIKSVLYLVLVIVINIAGTDLFFRLDLTKNKIYSLSPASRNVVSTLSEPMTINVFFTENLPAPYNGNRRYLEDLLEEYAIYAKKPYFNYRFYDVSSGEEGSSQKTEENQKLAESYGIFPVQIRILEQDELKFKNAYMGLVIIHGDLMEKIPAITSVNHLEYQLTTAMLKLNNKISRLASLKDKVKVHLVLSSSLKEVGPYMRVPELAEFAQKVKETVNELSKKNYNRLEFDLIDPDKEQNLDELSKKYPDLMFLEWPEIKEKNIKPGKGAIGLVMEYDGKSRTVALLHVFRIPILGTQYKLVDENSLKEIINKNMETLIGINQEIGYLADHGTIPLYRSGTDKQQQYNISHFREMLSDIYSLSEIKLSKDQIPDSLPCLIIAKPTEKFSDYDLYLIDQALMRGTSLAVFSDSFKENRPDPTKRFMGPTYTPIDTGLEKLLAHYGIHIGMSYVMDKHCFEQPISNRQGTGGKRPIYFAPIIQNENINHDLDFMKNIKGLVTLKNSPVSVDIEKIEKNGLKAYRIISSSKEAWLQKERINLNPYFITPPSDDSSYKQYDFAWLVEGSFTSYFAGKPIPEKKTDDDEAKAKDESGTDENKTTPVKAEREFIEKGRNAKIFVMGSSAILSDNLVDENGETPNALFVANIIDALCGRDDIAYLRSKTQRFNPLKDITPSEKRMVKTVNIAVLPVLIALIGLLAWWRRSMKRRRIHMMFSK